MYASAHNSASAASGRAPASISHSSSGVAGQKGLGDWAYPALTPTSGMPGLREPPIRLEPLAVLIVAEDLPPLIATAVTSRTARAGPAWA